MTDNTYLMQYTLQITATYELAFHSFSCTTLPPSSPLFFFFKLNFAKNTGNLPVSLSFHISSTNSHKTTKLENIIITL
jgi:hypothetical protein